MGRVCCRYSLIICCFKSIKWLFFRQPISGRDITVDEDNYKSSIVKVKPGLQLIANKKMRTYSSPRHIAKPPVIGCSSVGQL